MRTGKIGCALGTVLVAMAICGPAAQASPETPTLTEPNGAASVVLTTETDTAHEFKVTSGIVKCTGMNIEETTVLVPAETITVHPTFESCKAFGVNAVVTTTGCNFLFHLTKNGAGAATTDIECEVNKHILVEPTGINCEITIEPQTGLEGVTFDNKGEGNNRDLTATINIENIKYKEIGAECVNPNGTDVNGKYTGSSTVIGFKDEAGHEGARAPILID